jgi:hypothetical protein
MFAVEPVIEIRFVVVVPVTTMGRLPSRGVFPHKNDWSEMIRFAEVRSQTEDIDNCGQVIPWII